MAQQILPGIKTCTIAFLCCHAFFQCLLLHDLLHRTLYREGMQCAAPVNAHLPQLFAQGRQAFPSGYPIQVAQQCHQIRRARANSRTSLHIFPVGRQVSAPAHHAFQQLLIRLHLVQHPRCIHHLHRFGKGHGQFPIFLLLCQGGTNPCGNLCLPGYIPQGIGQLQGTCPQCLIFLRNAFQQGVDGCQMFILHVNLPGIQGQCFHFS